MKTLRRGSRDAEVMFLQRCLNIALGSVRGFPGIVEDSVFGGETDTWLRQFQRANLGRHGIATVDGVAGPATWRALGLQTEIDHNLPRVGQNTGMSCWVVSAGLATRNNQSVAPMIATFAADGGLDPSLDNLESFGSEIGFRLLPSVPPRIEELVPHIRMGPVLFVGTFPNGGRHMVVISGFYRAASPNSQMIKVNDPAPLAQGTILMTDYPGLFLSGGPIDPYCILAR